MVIRVAEQFAWHRLLLRQQVLKERMVQDRSLLFSVTSIDEQTATTTLQQSGFKVKVVRQQVADPSQNNVVLDESPPPNSQAKPGTTVTIYVGHFGGQTTSTTTTGP